jgi:glycosyltransferase involved in cell wall biosynthesis
MVNARPKVSIIIKALNEERHIAGAIESAIAALAGTAGEIILADSASTDRTVEIAGKYPIKIVRLTRVADRSCGTGVQLGYQYSAGDFICLIDGDMRLHAQFLPAALKFLEDNRQFAGVGGLIVERETKNLEYVKRAGATDAARRPGEVSRLDCGGVYRREAIEAVGYMADRNLHGGEEFELGVRLHALGWKLARIAMPAIDHFGHSGNPYALLRRRWTTGYAFAPGEILRATFGKRTFPLAVRKLRRELSLYLAVQAWWVCLIATAFLTRGLVTAAALPALALIPFATMALRCRSAALGLYSVTAWNVYAAGLWPGVFRRRTDSHRWIDSVVVHNAAPTAQWTDAA